MNATENRFDTMMVLSDLFSDEVVNGWAIPRNKVDQFIADVERAARESGAVPFVQMDFLEFDDAVTSLIGMQFHENRNATVLEAEEIILAAERQESAA